MESDTSYERIAVWYDWHINRDPLFSDVVLPELVKLIGPVEGQRICDIGCGQGWVARKLAKGGAKVMGFDISNAQLTIARRYEKKKPLGIVYRKVDVQVQHRQIQSHSFEGAVCVLSLMNIADIQATLQTIRRVLVPGGWLALVLTHPCFETPEAMWLLTNQGPPYRAVRGYFAEKFWIAPKGGVTSLVGQYHRTLSTYVNNLVDMGFVIKRMEEPIGAGIHAELVPGSLQVPRIVLIRAVLNSWEE